MGSWEHGYCVFRSPIGDVDQEFNFNCSTKVDILLRSNQEVLFNVVIIVVHHPMKCRQIRLGSRVFQELK